MSHNYVHALVEGPQGELWVGTRVGVSRFDRELERFEHFEGEPSDLPGTLTYSAMLSRSSELWFGSSGPSLLRFDDATGKLESYFLKATRQQDDGVWALAEDENGSLWCGTIAGELFRFDPSTGDSEPFPFSNENVGFVTTVFPRQDGQIWIGTDRQGLVALDPRTGDRRAFLPIQGQPGTVSNLQVSSIFRDRTGVIWLGTGTGLDKYVPQRERFRLLRHHVSTPRTSLAGTISTGLEDRSGTSWVGTENGLGRLDRDGRVVRVYRHSDRDPTSISDDDVRAIFEDTAGALWIATGKGVDRFDPTRGIFDQVLPAGDDVDSLVETIQSLAETDPSTLWIGGSGGLNRFDKAARSLKRVLHRPDTVLDMVADPGGSLWLATYGRGLGRLDPDTEALTRYRHDATDSHSLSSDFVLSLHLDQDGILWIGTLSGGLNRFDPADESFRHYRQRDGLGHDNVLSIVEDAAGDLWLGTERGLSRFDPESGTATKFTFQNGTQRSYFGGTGWSSATGQITFSGDDGLTLFHPEEIVGDSQPPEVVISDFLLLNRSTPFSARSVPDSAGASPHLVLDHRDDILAFEFAALHYLAPGRNRYAYRLEGFNTDWVETDASNRVAQYTNLDPGDYVFRVKASNPDGVWNKEGATVRLTVLPPPWQSGWAYALYGLALASGVGAYLRSHRRELRRERQAAAQEREVSRRLREVDQLKDEFLANTSHELSTPLYGMTGLAESLIDGATGELPEATKTNLSMIVASGQRLSHLVNDILDFSKLRHKSLELRRSAIDLRSLTEVVLTLSQPLIGSKPVTLVNAVSPDLPPAEADEDRLQQILYNLVGNAVKFTETGTVTVEAKTAEAKTAEAKTLEADASSGRLEVRVVDTGIGIPEAAQARIFDAFEQADASLERQYGGTGLGLAVTRQLVKLHGGSLRVESTEGEGSIFVFDLPLADTHKGDASQTESAAPEGAAARAETTPIALASAPTTTTPATKTATTTARAALEAATLLVVDDEPVNRQVLVNQLTAEGYRVVQAASGPEALELIEGQTPDLVLLDVMMPKMSGYEVCRTLRRDHPIDALPVVFLTAKGQASDLVVGLAAGANDYLPKPISKSELLARVATHLGLLDVHRQLSKLVDERTTQVRERERLLEERQSLIGELQARNAELAQFNYTVSHDLKNPLTTIQNFVGLARRDAATGRTDRLEHDLDRLQVAADKLDRLLAELLEYSRVRYDSNPSEDLRLNEVAQAALARLEETIAEADAQIELADDLPVVRGDRQRLEDLLRLLIDNALRYAGDSQPPRIRIAARPTADGPVFTVRDRGIGIDPRYQEKIFDLFERLDTDDSEGTGIGLALAKRIVEVHGGRIWVESEGSSKGSTFCFTLPLTETMPLTERAAAVS
ncbi:MAG: ATP-binding protein [Acidobacteriota bacterium]